jgi:hypothetical protein
MRHMTRLFAQRGGLRQDTVFLITDIELLAEY